VSRPVGIVMEVVRGAVAAAAKVAAVRVAAKVVAVRVVVKVAAGVVNRYR
jgi:hypothetical protein